MHGETMKFKNGYISFLDLLIIRNSSNLEIDIYRKTTTKNTTISFISNHPMSTDLQHTDNISPGCSPYH